MITACSGGGAEMFRLDQVNFKQFINNLGPYAVKASCVTSDNMKLKGTFQYFEH